VGVKVGDKVVLRKYPNNTNNVAWCREDEKYIGKTVTVTGICPDGDIEFDAHRPEYHWPPGYFDVVTHAPACTPNTIAPTPTPTKHSHYFKSVKGLDHIDVYRVLQLFGVTDPCIQHAVKKLLVAGGRGAGKDINRDIQESIDTLVRWQEMQTEGVNHAPSV